MDLPCLPPYWQEGHRGQPRPGGAPGRRPLPAAGPAVCPTIGGAITCPAGEFGDGGRAVEATLRSPRGVAVDPAGRVLIADTENNRVRLVTPPQPPR